MAQTRLSPIPASRPATGRISGAGATLGALRVIAGGRNRPALETVPKGELDELRIEIAVLRDEGRQLVEELLPVARRLEFYARADGSIGAWHLAAGLIERLTKYARRFEPRPAA